MKSLKLFLVLALIASAFAANAQTEERRKPTEEETIKYLKEQIEVYAKPYDRRKECKEFLKLKSISACQIRMEYTFDDCDWSRDYGEEYRNQIIPVSIFAGFNDGYAVDAKGDILGEYIKFEAPPAVLEKIEKAIKHLATFCIDDLF